MSYLKLKDVYKRNGVVGICDKIVIKGGGLLGIKLHIETLLCCNLYDKHSSLYSQIDFRELSYNDFLRQKDVNPEWFTSSKLDDMYAAFNIEGNKAYGYFKGDLIVCYGWISLKYLRQDKLLLLPEDGYLWDDYTHHEFRGNGYHTELVKFRCSQLIKYGKKRALSITARSNNASRSGFLKTGFIPKENFLNYKFGTRPFKSTLNYNGERLVIFD